MTFIKNMITFTVGLQIIIVIVRLINLSFNCGSSYIKAIKLTIQHNRGNHAHCGRIHFCISIKIDGSRRTIHCVS